MRTTCGWILYFNGIISRPVYNKRVIFLHAINQPLNEESAQKQSSDTVNFSLLRDSVSRGIPHTWHLAVVMRC